MSTRQRERRVTVGAGSLTPARHGELNAAAARMDDVDLAARATDDPPHQGQAYAHVAGLRRVLSLEDPRHVLWGDARPPVPHAHDEVIGRLGDPHPDPAARLGRFDDRIDGIVDEVPEHGDRVELGQRLRQAVQTAARVDAEVDPALPSHRALGDEEAGDRRVRDAGGHTPIDRVVAVLDGRDELASALNLAQRQQPVDGVEAVRVLMSLRAQRPDEQRQALHLPSRGVEQLGDMDADCRMIGQGREDRDLALHPGPRLGAVRVQHTEHPIALEQHGNRHHRTVVLAERQLTPRSEPRILKHILDRDRGALLGRPTGYPLPELNRLDLVEVVRVAWAETGRACNREPGLRPLGHQDDRGGVGVHELGGRARDLGEGLVQRAPRRERPADPHHRHQLVLAACGRAAGPLGRRKLGRYRS